jgi:hypothetical protein
MVHRGHPAWTVTEWLVDFDLAKLWAALGYALSAVLGDIRQLKRSHFGH